MLIRALEELVNYAWQDPSLLVVSQLQLFYVALFSHASHDSVGFARSRLSVGENCRTGPEHQEVLDDPVHAGIVHLALRALLIKDLVEFEASL